MLSDGISNEIEKFGWNMCKRLYDRFDKLSAVVSSDA